VPSADEPNAPVKAKTVLIDPDSMTVLWMNESASQDFSDRGSDAASGIPVEQAVPMAEMMGVPEALRAVADTGVARHLRTDLVSTSKGSLAIATSIYRLPDGKLLMVTENAWQAQHGTTSESGSRRSGRRGR
jgi:hypothetical protein